MAAAGAHPGTPCQAPPGRAAAPPAASSAGIAIPQAPSTVAMVSREGIGGTGRF